MMDQVTEQAQSSTPSLSVNTRTHPQSRHDNDTASDLDRVARAG